MVAKLKLVDSSAGGSPWPLGRLDRRYGARLRATTISRRPPASRCCACIPSLGRAEGCRAMIDEHDEAVAVSGVIRANPLLRDELSNRAFVSYLPHLLKAFFFKLRITAVSR